ncbi:hypothetical protein ASD53_12525 [Lysobacter sp. Root559]|uniref:glycoside hydrolase family 99-like domain-containing protein n=1 Tax=Lysobacter sp. Root559 TaxID=1736559 RepID=UPI0006FFE05C|nr:glycoside hydrolase family 99-like domain-containing protein [Lysobacter sp. Root559]KQZ56370.1 hypothetical protein ASD53_12525 [Lysobacter sp. Root559]
MAKLRSWIGRALHASYRRLPLDWERRLAIKGWLFRNFRSVFGRTNAYQRWLNHGGSFAVPAMVEAGSPGSQSASGAPQSSALLERYAEALRAHSSTAHGSEYVAMPADLAAPTQLAAKAIAFYLPQFHPIAENDEWWGRGFTEWTNVSKALPQFIGHHQPHLPGELGFYDLRLVDVMRRQAELAKLYGLHGFCFHHYWFSGRRLLERPLDQLIAHPDIDLPFCLCWANENWTRRWDGHDEDILLGQDHSHDNDLNFIHDALPYLRDSRYIRIDGRPLLIVYRPSLLPDCKRTLEVWREHCREQGLGEIFLAMVQFDIDDPGVFGFDAALEFPPHKIGRGLRSINHTVEIVNPDYAGHILDYAELADRGKHWPTPNYPLFKGVVPRWDNEARKPGKGYSFAHSTPERYRDWLEHAVSYSHEHPVCGESVVFINAWNEWAEGAHLEPDRRYGYAYLQATRDAIEVPSIRPSADIGAVAIVAHDAHPHGAQYLSLNLVRELARMGVPVEAVLLGGGMLEPEFHDSAPTTVLDASNDAELASAARALRARGVDVAIANTTVSGRFARHLYEAGIEVVSLVHELPGVIEQYSLAGHACDIADTAVRVVFAADAVKQGFERYASLAPQQALIRPQGLYKRNALRHDIASARRELRDELGLAQDAEIVLCVGYADLRKGVDLFVQVAERVCRERAAAHFVWVGHPDVSIEREVRASVARAGLADRLHFIGRRSNTDHYYAGADLYALTSREDPYPSVVLESFDVGVPVVGFAGTGGLDALIQHQCGSLAPMLDIEAYADQCLKLLADRPRRQEISERVRELIESEYSFRSYVLDLLALTRQQRPLVSVVVPNYNYAHYLAERLDSIVRQTLPVYEIIVLDDASSDESVSLLRELQASSPVPLRVIASSQNSGSVFRQWLKGVEAARGDVVWIAEADDLSAPDFLATVTAPLARSAVAMSYCQSTQIDGTGRTLAPDYLDYVSDLGRERWTQPFVATLSEELDHGLAVKNTVPNVSAAVFRRDVLLRSLKGAIDEITSYRIAGDWLTYLKVLEHGDLAFAPIALNRHRRHSGSVTIGSDNLPHLREVLRMQQLVRKKYSVSPRMQALAREYAEHLHHYFGLADEQVKVLSDRKEVQDLLT